MSHTLGPTRPHSNSFPDTIYYVIVTVMQIASLPHVELEFVVPRSNQRHRSLFMLDTGAGGTELMFHSRAAKELGLLVSNKVGCAGMGNLVWCKHACVTSLELSLHLFVALCVALLAGFVHNGWHGCELCSRAATKLDYWCQVR